MGLIKRRFWGRRPDFYLPVHRPGKCILYPAKASPRKKGCAIVENGNTLFTYGGCQLVLLRGNVVEDMYFSKMPMTKFSYEETTLPLLGIPPKRADSYDWHLLFQNKEAPVEAFYLIQKNIPSSIILPIPAFGGGERMGCERRRLKLRLENSLLFINTLANYGFRTLSTETFSLFLWAVIQDKGKDIPWEDGLFCEKLPLWLGEIGFGVKDCNAWKRVKRKIGQKTSHILR